MQVTQDLISCVWLKMCMGMNKTQVLCNQMAASLNLNPPENKTTSSQPTATHQQALLGNAPETCNISEAAELKHNKAPRCGGLFGSTHSFFTCVVTRKCRGRQSPEFTQDKVECTVCIHQFIQLNVKFSSGLQALGGLYQRLLINL